MQPQPAAGSSTARDRANWFIGLRVPAETWWARIGEPPPGVRLFAPDDVHVTVAFLGPVGQAAAEAAFAIAPRWPAGPLEATLGHVVPMGNPRRPSALSALVSGNDADLVLAIATVRDEMCRRAGARIDDRPPLPHATIARPTRSASHSDIRAALAWARDLDLGAPAVRLSEIVLYTRAEDRSVRLFREHAVHALAAPFVSEN